MENLLETIKERFTTTQIAVATLVTAGLLSAAIVIIPNIINTPKHASRDPFEDNPLMQVETIDQGNSSTPLDISTPRPGKPVANVPGATKDYQYDQVKSDNILKETINGGNSEAIDDELDKLVKQFITDNKRP